MKLILCTMLLFCFVLTGCTGGKVYVFEKERVDQSTEGNRGYVMGTPPSAPVQGKRTRTIIGMDVEVGLFPGEKATVSPEEIAVYGKKEKAVIIGEKGILETEKISAEGAKTGEPAPRPKGIIVKETSEEDWVK